MQMCEGLTLCRGFNCTRVGCYAGSFGGGLYNYVADVDARVSAVQTSGLCPISNGPKDPLHVAGRFKNIWRETQVLSNV